MLLTLSVTIKQQSRAPPTPSREQCLVLMGRFDQNGDGEISKNEFTYLVEFIFVVNYIESVKPTSKVWSR